jgi:hypothetical protein
MKNITLTVITVFFSFIFTHTIVEAQDIKRRILLLGASVGYEWDLPGWPKRMNDERFIIEMKPEYSFDKRNALEEILLRPKRKFRLTRTYLKGFFQPALRKPDVIILKECAAYFPGDLEKYKDIIQQMVKRCEDSNIKPVLATVVPVTEEHSLKKPGRLEAILSYNDWIKSYAQKAGLVLIDLESSLRVSEKNRSLRPELTDGDGLHLNRAAYDILDKTFLESLKSIFPERH